MLRFPESTKQNSTRLPSRQGKAARFQRHWPERRSIWKRDCCSRDYSIAATGPWPAQGVIGFHPERDGPQGRGDSKWSVLVSRPVCFSAASLFLHEMNSVLNTDLNDP